jgi:hypothetical protein
MFDDGVVGDSYLNCIDVEEYDDEDREETIKEKVRRKYYNLTHIIRNSKIFKFKR